MHLLLRYLRIYFQLLENIFYKIMSCSLLIFYIFTPSGEWSGKAEEFFRYALEADNRNFPALLQLLQTYIANPGQESGRHQRNIWTRRPRFLGWTGCHFYVQKGLFVTMWKEYEEPFKFWAMGYQKNSACLELDLQVG